MEFCPKIEPITTTIEELKYNEKLDLIEKEAQSLYLFCLSKEFSDLQVRECVTKLHGAPIPISKKIALDSSRSLLYIAVFVGIIAAVIASPPAYCLVCANLKLASVKFVLPFWNFSELYDEECLIGNPYLPKKEVVYNRERCSYCINVAELGNNTVDRLKDTNGEEINKYYIDYQQPVVVTDTTKDWIDKKKLSMDEMIKLYLEDPVMSQNLGSCVYNNSVGLNETFYDFHSAYSEKKLPETWTAGWVNCDRKAGKILRHFYTRPYFLPQMAQASPYSVILVGKGHQEDWIQELKVEKNAVSATWVTVVQGVLRIKLIPAMNCKNEFQCLDTELELGPGETVFYTVEWDQEYKAASNDITIAISSAVIWDY